jgi:hypothetical protein
MPDFVVDSILAGVAILIAVAIVLVFFDVAALPVPEQMAPVVPPRAGLSRAAKLRRLVAVVAVVAVVAALIAGIRLVDGDPLRAAGPATGSGSLYLGTAPATYGGTDNIVFAAAPGGEIQMEFSLVNTGAFPLTITGMNEPINGSPMWEMDGYFASGSVVPAGQASDGTTHRFEIQPHVSVPVVAILHLRKCTPSTPAAPAPGQTPSAWAAVAAEAGGFTSFGSLTIVYEMLGLTYTTTLVLPANLVMIDANSVLCPGDGSAPPTNYP